MRTIWWKDGVAVTFDQTKLPSDKVFLEMKECSDAASAIREMRVRGAPLIGVTAAYGLALAAYHSKAEKRDEMMKEINESAEVLRRSRPTAVNLFWAIDRVLKRARTVSGNTETLAKAVLDEAQKMADEDVEANRRMGEYGAKLIREEEVVLTHCNAGSLATVDYGTALGVIRAAWNQGKKISVIATETRPKLQGARLTTYELKRDGIPVTLITDSMVGYVMSKRLVDKVIVGADRIVQDAVINKIGTYTIAVLAQEHKVPFYVAAPRSTFNLKQTSEDVTIEERSSEEVTHFRSQRIAPSGIKALNPAFDITPLKYVEAVICESGVLSTSELERLTADYGTRA
ncbi:MAG: S-methyl-5-thioribose-1-phosphate isomerase [Candidatus Bathyarchaeota archaeon]|nr:MAG: S-methyl-5-thioribose-1-phosphate isomerase [Candidatus Bathyarchaeota archaeon]